MTIEKFNDIVCEEIANENMQNVYITPENWPQVRNNFIAFMKEIDAAHEVYVMENSGK